jgi:hypothetical protein
MLLCDHAQVAEGKLFVSGGGWTVTTAGQAPMGVAVLIQVPWDRSNRDITFALTLRDSDGNPVIGQVIDGVPTPISLQGDFQVGRPPGVAPGSSLAVPLAVNLPPPPLEPGKRYEWTLELDGDSHEDWTLPFSTRPHNPLQLPGFPV